MSAILKKHLQAASARSKNYTDTEIVTFASTINNTLSAHNLRITELENNSGSSSTTGEYFYFDDDGDMCQALGEINPNVYIIAGKLYVDNDGDICQAEEIQENQEQS